MRTVNACAPSASPGYDRFFEHFAHGPASSRQVTVPVPLVPQAKDAVGEWLNAAGWLVSFTVSVVVANGIDGRAAAGAAATAHAAAAIAQDRSNGCNFW